MKRFYQEVSLAAAADGHRVLLDRHSLHTPAGQVLAVPVPALAEAVAAEWRTQGETTERATMALTRLVNTALDRMPELRAAAIDEVVGHAETDLVCYRAAAPLELVDRQLHVWQPWLDWLSRTHGVQLAATTSMLPLAQSGEALQRLRATIEQLDDWRLVGLHAATTGLGSVVLGLALTEGWIDAERALAASLLDELFELERWGRDSEAERRHQTLQREVEATARFLACLREPGHWTFGRNHMPGSH